MLVVGGTGFIGRRVANAAAARGLQVSATSLRGYRSAELADGVEVLKLDLGDREGVGRMLNGRDFDYVVNCSGYIDHSPYAAGGRRVLDAHFGGVLNLLEALDRRTLKAFVQLGSSDEYGDAPAPQRESDREAPIAPYSAAKVALTHLLQMLNRSEGFPAIVLRLFLVYGPGQDPARFLPQIIAGCIEGHDFPVSAGEQLRDFCYVDDAVGGILAALDAPGARGRVINLASGQPVRIRELIETVRAQIGRGKPLYGRVPYRAGENMALYADTTLARELLGWRAETSLADGLARTIAWYLVRRRGPAAAAGRP